MIKIPAEALFDLLEKRKARFRHNYIAHYIQISDENVYNSNDIDNTGIYMTITKSGFMELLFNRVFVCDEYELKIGI